MGDDTVQSSCTVYYCTERGKVKGELQISQTRVFFNPLKCEHNEGFDSLKPFKVVIDMGDVLTTNIKKFINETGQYVEDATLKNSYMFDYFIQFDLAEVNRQKVNNKKQGGCVQEDDRVSFLNNHLSASLAKEDLDKFDENKKSSMRDQVLDLVNK